MSAASFVLMVYASCATLLALAAWGVSRRISSSWRHVAIGCIAGMLIAPYGIVTEGGEYFFPSGYILFLMTKSLYNPLNDIHLLLTMVITTVFCGYGSSKYLRFRQVRPD